MHRLDLPDANIALHPGYFPAAAADNLRRQLLREVAWRQDTIRLFGRRTPIPRMTAWQGTAGYRYSGIDNPPAPWTPAVAAIRADMAELTSRRFNGVLLNLYRDGRDHMGWHSDDEADLGPDPLIASVSFGACRRFRLRHRVTRQTTAIDLGHGDVLIMSGATQAHWQHAIAKTARPVDQRLNLTFRAIA